MFTVKFFATDMKHEICAESEEMSFSTMHEAYVAAMTEMLSDKAGKDGFLFNDFEVSDAQTGEVYINTIGMSAWGDEPDPNCPESEIADGWRFEQQREERE